MKCSTKPLMWMVLTAFLVNTSLTVPVQADVAFLPAPGQMISLTPSFSPTIIRGIKLYKDNPFKFDFIIDAGDSKLGVEDPAIKEAGKKLIGYFLASLAIPEKDMWVNLSPYEKDRIIPDNFGNTEMGSLLLAQDYLLKQVAASIMYPEGKVGKEFWQKISIQAREQFGTNNVPVDTLNKVWIVPENAVVYENSTDNSVIVVKSSLTVMLEEDYLGEKYQKKNTDAGHQLSNDMVRKVILPVLKEEVNEGKNFAALRQVYNSLILAAWYKNHLKQSVLSKGYVDRNKTGGVDIEDKGMNQEIYQQYLKAFRKGVFNYIKEEVDPVSNAVVPKKYFSGGVTWGNISGKIQSITGTDAAQLASKAIRSLRMIVMTVGLVAGLSGASLAASYDQQGTTAIVAKGDTAANIVARSPAYKAIAKMTHKQFKYADFQHLVSTHAITLEDAKGSIVQDPKWDTIQPGQKIKFDLNSLNDVKPAAVAATPTIAAPAAVTPAAPVSAAPNQAVANTDVVARTKMEIKKLQEEIARSKRTLTSVQQMAADIALVDQFKLTMLPQPSYKVSTGVTFTPNAASLAYVDYQIKNMEQTANKPIKSQLPVNGLLLGSYNSADLTLPIISSQGNSFSIVPNIPGRDLLNLGRMVQGFTHFGAQTAMNQVAGPLFAAQIVADLRNYVVTHPTRGQDVRYDARMKGLDGIIQSLTVHVTPIYSFDQNNNPVTEYLYSVGAVDTVQALFGVLDGAFGNTGFLGDSKKRFVVEDLGYQLKINDYHQAFNYGASVNVDPNVMAIKVYQVDNAKIRHRKNKDNGWDVIEDGAQPLDPYHDYYSATVKGFVLRYDPAAKKITGQQVFTAPTFITGAFAKSLATGTNINYLSGPLIERQLSIKDLKEEKKLLRGIDDKGKIILGALRHPVTGHIERFITNPRELNTVSSLSDAKGNTIQFAPGKATIQEENGADIAGDYAGSQFKDFKDRWSGLFQTTTVADKYSAYDLSKRPQLTSMPLELKGLLSGDQWVFDPAKAMEAITRAGEQYSGVVYFADGRMPAPLKDMGNVRMIDSLSPANGVKANADGSFSFKGFPKRLNAKTLVVLDARLQAVGVLDPSIKAKQTRLKGLANFGVAINEKMGSRALMSPDNGFTPAKFAGVVGRQFGAQAPAVTITENMLVKVVDGRVVEILEPGIKALQNQAVVMQTLNEGGVQVEDQRTDKFVVFAKGNNLRPNQKALGILPEKELADLILSGQAVMVPVEGTQQLRYIILKEAPKSRMQEIQLNYREPPEPAASLIRLAGNGTTADILAAHFQPQFPTVLGFNGEPFHGVTIEAQMFTEADIPKLIALGADTVRSYYPIPIELVQKLVQAGIKNIVVSLPLNGDAYGPENLSSFWGKAVPAAQARISLDANNYIPYVQQLKNALSGKAKLVVELLNEPNTDAHYPAWTKKPANEATYKELFGLIDVHARNIHAQAGRDVFVSTVLWDTPRHFPLALATDVDGIGVNYYRHNSSLTGDVLNAYEAAGLQKPFYIAEAGENSNSGRRNQAAIVLQDAQIFNRMGISATFMSLGDNGAKGVHGAGEAHWGWWGKPVYRLMSREWGGTGFVNAPPVKTDTLAGIGEKYVLIRWKPDGSNRSATDWVTEETLNKYADIIAPNALEVLKIGPKGETVGRYVKILDDDYELWGASDFRSNLNTHAMVIFKDGSNAEFIALDQLKDPQMHERIRKAASSIEMQDQDGNTVTRVYLDRNMDGSRIELITGNTSKIFELTSFSPSNLSYSVEQIVRTTDANGLLHVTKTDLRPVNKDVVVEDVYQPVPDAKPVLLYSVRNLQKETIYFKDGHERYSVSTDIVSEPGQAIVIDGRTVEHVSGLFDFNERTGIGFHVSLRDIQKKNWRVPVRRTVFADGQIKVDQTGFVKLEPGLSAQEIMLRVRAASLLTKQDIYTYDDLGKILIRQAGIQIDGKWENTWTIKGGAIAPQPGLVSQLAANSIIAQALAKYGLNGNTMLIETFKDTTAGVRTIDYRISGDVQERKFITVTQQGGSVINIIVGLDFDKRTGEQTLSYELTPDFQVKFLRETIPNNLSVRQILPANAASAYADLAKKRLNNANADLWQEAGLLGVSPEYVPVKLKKIPFLIDTDNPDPKGYRSTEPAVRALVRQYMDTDNNTERAGILDRIEDLVRQQNANKAHYTPKQGAATYHYLFPNDSRDRDFIEAFPNGEVSINMWWLEGLASFPINVLPASMVVDSSGSLQRSVFFDHSEKMTFRDPVNIKHTMQVNSYRILDAPFLQSSVYTAAGQLVIESTRYVRARVINGKAGVQTRGVETVYYDPFSPYPVPFFGLLDEDNRITKVLLNETFKSNNSVQEIVNSSLEAEPTAPDIHKVKTQTIIDGTPVEGSRYEEDAFWTYWNDIVSYWKVYFTVPAVFSVLFSIGGLIGKRRLADAKKKAGEADREPAAPARQRVPADKIPYPSWNHYGASESVVYTAHEKFKGSILPALERGESLQSILDENFEAYRIWRKEVMKIDEPFTPTMEDLWVKLLLDVDGDIFNADLPDGLNYLFHKTIEARANGRGDGINGFVRKEYTRWHNILELQQTTFQGLEGGSMKNVVPYDFYFRIEDLNDMFLNKAQMEWYDNLGYTLDGRKDMRDAIYDDFTATLQEKVAAVKRALHAIAGSLDNNVFRMKRRATALPEYQDYIQFFRQVQKGEFQTRVKSAEELINGKPLMLKTFSDSGAWNGILPMPLRLVKAFAQLARNNYNQLMYGGMLSLGTGLTVAAFDGKIESITAAVVAGTAFIALKILSYPLNYLLNRNVNSTAFGKPLSPWTGYERLKPTKEQSFYRKAFWSAAITAKVAWDAFLFHYFLIPHAETIGATYYPNFFGFELPLDMNFLLMGAQWSTSAFFLFLSSWASYYAVGGIFSFIHGALRGLGTVKTPQDIRELQKDGVLIRLIEEKLLPEGGRGMDEAAKEKARLAIMDLIFDQMRARDEISDAEWKAAYNGTLDQFASEQIQKRVAVAVNALLMKMPRMPKFDDIASSTILTPVYGEDIIYAYDETVDTPTSLDVVLNVGFTNLNFIISKAQDRWANFIERVKREGTASPEEIARMEYLLTHTGKLGPLNETLKMEVRLWATYEGQAFGRTLDGTMNYVRMLRLLAKISHPEWDETTIRAEANKKFQMLWAYQIWGDILHAKDSSPGKALRKFDTLYLLKKYHDELGFDIDIASLQKAADGTWHRVLSRYSSKTGAIEDVDAIRLTVNNAIHLEGKPSNQMNAGAFVRNEIMFTVDMNQDIFPEQAVKLPILLQEYKDKNVALVNFPEQIFTSAFSLTGFFHAIADRTFVSSSKRHLSMLLSPFHHGHPDGWRSSVVRQHGGVSSTTSVSEDFIGGLRLVLRGKRIKNVEYIEFGKAREVSWAGTDGIKRKFAMGAGQYMLSRWAYWGNQRLGILEGAANNYGGTPFYFKEMMAAFGLFAYAFNVMVLGISAFAAFPAAIVTATAGVLVVGQAITMNGFTQMALEDGAKKAVKTFTKVMPAMAPFYIAHIFTYAAGFLSGLSGAASYVVTGRGFGREHIRIDALLKAYSKSHIIVGLAGLTLAVIAVNIWWNWTVLSSALTIFSFIFPMVMPFVMNPGNYPVNGVGAQDFLRLFKTDKKIVKDFLVRNYNEGMAKGDYRKAYLDTTIYGLSAAVWYAITAPVAFVADKLTSKKEPLKPRIEPTFATVPSAPAPVEVPAWLRRADNALITEQKGGIDLGKTAVTVKSDGEGVTTAFDDPAMLQLLLNSDGLTPIIYNIQPMTLPMIDRLIGGNP